MSQRQNFPGTSPFEPVIGFSRAVRVGSHVMVSGTGPVGCDDADIAGQTGQCLTIIADILKQAGTSFEHVVRTRIYLTDVNDWEAAGRVHGNSSRSSAPPPPWSLSRRLLTLAGRSRSKSTPSSPNKPRPRLF